MVGESMPFEVTVSGAGKAVVFIPGFACSGRAWDPVVTALHGVEAHVVTFAGFAGAPPVSQPSLARIHAALVRYVHDNGLLNAVVVGHSLGGHMALWLAATLPALGGVVDVEGFPFLAGASDPTMTEARAVAAVASTVAQFREMSSEELTSWIRQNMGGMFTGSHDRERVLAESVRSDVETVAQLFGDGVAKNLRADLGKIQAPTTIVVASKSAVPDPNLVAQWEEQVAAIPHHELVFMEGSHFVMYDQPDAFLALLNGVVASAADRSTGR